MTGWLYRQSEDELWTVGYYYGPDQKWEPETDHGSEEEAAARVHWLNGGLPPTHVAVTGEMRALAGEVRSLCADYLAAQAEYEHDLGGDSDGVIKLGEKLSDLAGDLARLVDPQD